MNVRLQQKHRRLKVEQEKQVARIRRDTDANPVYRAAGATGATAAGDWERLRGLPAIGRGVRGAIRGSSPQHRNLD